MFVLPVSQMPVTFRIPNGRDELLLAEGSINRIQWRVEVVKRLALPTKSSVNWGDLPYPDVDAALLGWRQALHGDHFVIEVCCSHCNSWDDVRLSVAQYLAAKCPGSARRMKRLELRSGKDGWWNWKHLRFKIPTVDAVAEAYQMDQDDVMATRRLAALCVGVVSEYEPKTSDPGDTYPPTSGIKNSTNTKQRRRIPVALNHLMERIAPPLSGLIQGICPNCSAEVQGWFDPGAFVLSELQQIAVRIFEDVHLLAHWYGWTEDVILDLPVHRRRLYASRIQQECQA